MEPINTSEYKIAAQNLSTEDLLKEISQLTFEKNSLSPHFSSEKISNYDKIIKIYSSELLSRKDLNTYNYTTKPH